MWILSWLCCFAESNEDVDDDWEREFDIEDTEVATLSEQLVGTERA
jgi:hypothetical protein